MSDPTSLDEVARVAGSIGGGGIFSLLVAKLLLGNSFKETEGRIEAKIEAIAGRLEAMKESITESRTTMKESLGELRDQLNRSGRRHDSTLEDIGVLKQSSLAIHSRVDELQRDIESMRREK